MNMTTSTMSMMNTIKEVWISRVKHLSGTETISATTILPTNISGWRQQWSNMLHTFIIIIRVKMYQCYRLRLILRFGELTEAAPTAK